MNADQEAAVAKLRDCRDRLEGVRAKLQTNLQQQTELEKEREALLAEQRAVRADRNEAVLAADAHSVPRLTIAKEAGMQRSNVYKLLDEKSPGS
jgi:uncharacterized protein (DUF3084 family)